MRSTCIASYTANMAMGHVASWRFGPRIFRERFECYHRVTGPTRPYGNTHIHLERSKEKGLILDDMRFPDSGPEPGPQAAGPASWGRTGYVAHGRFLLSKMLYNTQASPRGPCVAIQLYSYTALYIKQIYIAIHYTTYATALWLVAAWLRGSWLGPWLLRALYAVTLSAVVRPSPPPPGQAC